MQARQDLSFSYNKLGDISRAQGDLAGAWALYEKGLAIRERLAAETGTVEARQNLAVSYKMMGDLSQARGDLAKAWAFYEKGHAIDEQLAAEIAKIKAYDYVI